MNKMSNSIKINMIIIKINIIFKIYNKIINENKIYDF